MFKRILIAIDDSNRDRQAIELGARLVRSGAHRVALVHVMPPMYGIPEAATVLEKAYFSERNGAAEDLKRARTMLPRAIEVDELVLDGSPADVVAATGEEWQADLVIVGTRRRGRLRNFVVGSVAQEIIRRASCPVLVARQYEDELPMLHSMASSAALIS